MNLKAFTTILSTETHLALRQGDMPFFGIIFPAALMLLMGFLSSPEGLVTAFCGISVIGISASGLMGIPLTFSNYRHAGILKRFKVTPASPAILLLAVGTLQALFSLVSGLSVFVIAHLFFSLSIPGNPFTYILTFVFVQFSVYSLGVLVAALAPNIKIANIACMLLYFPMLLLSGATIPYHILPKGLTLITNYFPLTQGIILLQKAATNQRFDGDIFRIVLITVIALVCYLTALKTFRWE